MNLCRFDWILILLLSLDLQLAQTFLEPSAIMITLPICLPVVVVLVEGPIESTKIHDIVADLD